MPKGVFAAFAVAFSMAALGAQSELVIYKEGSKQYHRPSCPVVADMKGVVAMTRAQAEARKYTPHEGCDPANPNATPPKAAPRPETVYLDGSKYYHRKTCSRLEGAKNVKAASLESAGKEQWPCPTCKPPVRRRSIENAVPGTKRRGG